MITIEFVKIFEDSKLPTQAKPGDAAFDLTTVEDFTLAPGETKAVSTGLVLANVIAEESIFLQIVGRSGLALKGIFPLGGIIDSSYRGEIKVILHNGNPRNWSRDIREENLYSSMQTKIGGHYPSIPDPNKHITYTFNKGDRIAQMIIQRVVIGKDALIYETSEITETERGGGGFGSTGR